MEIRNILWASDFNPLSNYAFEWAKYFALKFNAKLHAIHVIPESETPIFERKEEIENMFNLMEKERIELAKQSFEAKRKELYEQIEFETYVFKGEVKNKIVEFVNEKNIDLLVLGASSKEEKQKIGTTSYRILTEIRIPVLVVKEEKKRDVKKILVPIDFTKLSFKALEYAILLSKRLDAEIHVLHVVEILGSMGLRETEEKLIEETTRLLKMEREKYKEESSKIFVNALKRDSAEIGIIEFAIENDIDIICIATRGKRGLSHFFLGSVAEKVLRLSEVPVIAFNPV
ncbi:MAG: universal stress protein [Candidatus Hydrothermales bacterium]